MENILYKKIYESENHPKYSIIISIYNGYKYLTNIFSKIYNQNFNDFEIVIVDDASIDNTFNFINELNTKKNITYIKNDKNYGVSISRSIAINNIKGKYFLFIDVDDDFSNDLLLSIDNIINTKNPDLIIYGFSEEYYKKNKKIFYKDRLIENNNLFFNNIVDIRKYVINLEKNTILGYNWNKCYKTEIIKRFNINFFQSSIYEDLFFNLSYIDKIETMYYLNKNLYTYVNIVDGDSVTKKNYENYFDMTYDREREVYKYFKKWGVLDNNSKNLILESFIRYAYSELVRSFSYKNKNIYKKYNDIINKDLFIELKNNNPNYKKNNIFKNILNYVFINKIFILVYIFSYMIFFIKKYFVKIYLKIAK